MYRASKSLTTLLKLNEDIQEGGSSMEIKTNKIEIRKADWFEMQHLNDLVIKSGMYYSKAGKIIDTYNKVLLDKDVREEITENAYVVVLNKEIIGLTTVWGKNKTIISNLFIRQDYRRKGYGKALLNYIMKDKKNCVVVLMDYYNVSINFYKHLGFKVINVTKSEIKDIYKILWLSQDKGDNMKEYLVNINDKDYAIVDKNNVVDYKELKHILLTIKKVFDFMENNKEEYTDVIILENDSNIKLDCVKDILKDKYHDDIELVNKEVKRIDTGICI